jgi:hypothetical protein
MSKPNILDLLKCCFCRVPFFPLLSAGGNKKVSGFGRFRSQAERGPARGRWPRANQPSGRSTSARANVSRIKTQSRRAALGGERAYKARLGKGRSACQSGHSHSEREIIFNVLRGADRVSERGALG